MSGATFALRWPRSGVRLDPTPVPKGTRLQKGDWVRWLVDGDQGEVTGMVAGRAIAIRWVTTNRIEAYPFCGGSMHFVQRQDTEGGNG